MSRAFTVLWTMQERQTWLQSGASEFGSAFGNSYRSRGVEPGDALYILSCGQGNVWLWGRLVVKSIEDPNNGAMPTGPATPFVPTLRQAHPLIQNE
ncbi:MAG: hypothetical protein ACOYNP_03945 [Gemmataceae bacterium]